MEFQVHTVTQEKIATKSVFDIRSNLPLLFLNEISICKAMPFRCRFQLSIVRDEIIKARKDVIENTHVPSNNQRKCSLTCIFHYTHLSLFLPLSLSHSSHSITVKFSLVEIQSSLLYHWIFNLLIFSFHACPMITNVLHTTSV